VKSEQELKDEIFGMIQELEYILAISYTEDTMSTDEMDAFMKRLDVLEVRASEIKDEMSKL
jgi:hypothetical protein